MRTPVIVPLVVGILAMAGCLGDNGADGALEQDDYAERAGPEPAAAPSVLTWDGHMVVGAAFEAPAHFTPTDDLVRPVWSTGFVIEVAEVPDVLEISVDWTSTGPASIMLMVHAPHGAEREGEQPGWSEYRTHGEEVWAAEGPLCIRVPSKDLAEDVAHVAEHGGHPYWYPMIHSQFGADVQLTVTVASVGGNVSIADAVHGHEMNEASSGAQAELAPKRPWEPCALETA